MELEEAENICKKIIMQNNEIVKQTRKNLDTNAMQLTANCDSESIAIETVLQALDNSIPKEKVEKIEKYCKTKSKFQTFGDEQLKRAIEVYVNKTKNDVLSLLEE